MVGYLHSLPRRLSVLPDLRAYTWSSHATYLTRGELEVGLSLRTEVSEVLERMMTEYLGWTYEQFILQVPEQEWEEFQKALRNRAVGSQEFLARVDEQQLREGSPRAEEPAAVAVPVQPMALSAPSVVIRGPASRSYALTASISLSVAALCAAALYAKNIAALKQTVRSLSQERSLPVQMFLTPESGTQTAQIARLTRPVSLAGTTWDLQLRSMEGGAVSDEMSTDYVRFDNSQVASAELAARGFGKSGYSVRLKADSTLVWETMQQGPGDEVVCWRGESDGGTMRGVMTRQAPGRAVASFSFVGALRHQDQRAAESTREI
jgi:hypothetical protein